MKAIIHVNHQIIRQNLKNKTKKAPITVRVKGKTKRRKSIQITGPCRIVYSPDKPLNCGARLWIETDHRNIK